MSETNTIETKHSKNWTPERKAKQAATREANKVRKLKDAQAMIDKARPRVAPPPVVAAPPIVPVSPDAPPAPLEYDGPYKDLAADCAKAFAMLVEVVRSGAGMIGEIFPWDSFSIKKDAEGMIVASWRCGWNDVNDPKKVVSRVWTKMNWSKKPDDIDVLRGYIPEKPRSEVSFEVFWEQ